jgi:AsmA protein
MRKALITIAIIVVVLIVIAVALPFFIDANQFKPEVEAEATKALGRQVTVGNLSLSVFSGGVSADNLSVADDPAYGKEPFLTAKSMAIGVEMWPLITSRKLNIQSFTINQPTVNLIHGTNGKWNVSTLGAKEAKPANEPVPAQNASKAQGGYTWSTPAQGEATPAGFQVGKFALKNGTITVQYQGTRAKPAVYSNVDMSATDVSLASAFPYQLSATPPGGGSLKVKGDFGPLSQSEAAQTPLTAALKIEKFDLASSGVVDPSSGMRGLLNLDANLKSDGKIAKLDGHGAGLNLCLVQGCSPAKEPVGLDFATDYNLARQNGSLTKGVLKLGKSAANLDGNFDMSGTAIRLNTKVDANNLAVNDIVGILPAIGVVLPSGANLEGGTANAHATITGPVDALVTAGSVNINNTKLTGYDLGSKLAMLSKFAGIQSAKETLIQLFSSDVRVSPQGTQVSQLKLVLPSIGTLMGDGVIGPKNDLNFKMNAQLQTQGNALGTLTQVAGFGGKNPTIPFHVTGTTSNPVFTPELAGAVGGLLSGVNSQQQNNQNPGNLINSLGGLFGKKKKP